MSSSYSSYYQEKGAYASRPATGSSTGSASRYAQSAHSSRSYGGKAPVIVHPPSGPIYDPNNSTSAANSGYHR